MDMKLYTSPQTHEVAKALIVAEYNSVPIEVIEISIADTKTPEFLEKNPTGSLPTLETKDGCIFESNAIARYLTRLNDNSKLYGVSPFEMSSIDSWLDFGNTEIRSPSNDIVPALLGQSGYNKPAAEAAKVKLHKVLATLDGYLLSRTYLVGKSVTLADIVVAVQLVPLFRLVFDPQFREPFVNVVRWFTTCVHQPQFIKVLGEVKFAEVSAQPPKQDKPQKQDKPKEEKPKEEKPKEKKKSQRKKKMRKRTMMVKNHKRRNQMFLTVYLHLLSILMNINAFTLTTIRVKLLFQNSMKLLISKDGLSGNAFTNIIVICINYYFQPTYLAAFYKELKLMPENTVLVPLLLAVLSQINLYMVCGSSVGKKLLKLCKSVMIAYCMNGQNLT